MWARASSPSPASPHVCHLLADPVPVSQLRCRCSFPPCRGLVALLLSRAYAAPLAYIDGSSAPGPICSISISCKVWCADLIHRRGWDFRRRFPTGIVCKPIPPTPTRCRAAADRAPINEHGSHLPFQRFHFSSIAPALLRHLRHDRVGNLVRPITFRLRGPERPVPKETIACCLADFVPRVAIWAWFFGPS